jgi:malonate transporter and related proteins
MGPQAAGPVILVLSIDLIVFSSLITLIITGHRQGRVSPAMAGALALGLLKNPMIVSMGLGLIWGATGTPLPAPLDEFLTLLGAAATPCALFAIGASLVGRRAERVAVAAWLSFAKLVLHPAAAGATSNSTRAAKATAALPVAGNVFILAQHYGVAPHRVSSSILISTVVSVLTVSAVIALVQPML